MKDIDLPQIEKQEIIVNDIKFVIYHVFSIGTFLEFLKATESLDYRRRVAMALHRDISKEKRIDIPSVEEILNAPENPCQKYIEIVLNEHDKIKKYYGQNYSENDIYKRFYLSVLKYNKYITNIMRDSLQNIQEQLNKLVQSAAESIEYMNSMIKEGLKPLYDFQQQIESVINQISLTFPQINFEEWNENFKRWGEYGWTVCTPIIQLNQKIENVHEADKLALQYLNEQDMLVLFKELENMELNHDVLKEAIFCYNNKCFRACAMILCSMIDEKIYNIQSVRENKNEYRFKPNKFFEKLKEKCSKLDEKCKEEKILKQMFLLLEINNLISYLNKLFEQGYDFQLKTEVLNRNFLQHGMRKEPITEKECIQLFLALYNVIEVIDSLEVCLRKKNMSIIKIMQTNL